MWGTNLNIQAGYFPRQTYVTNNQKQSGRREVDAFSLTLTQKQQLISYFRNSSMKRAKRHVFFSRTIKEYFLFSKCQQPFYWDFLCVYASGFPITVRVTNVPLTGWMCESGPWLTFCSFYRRPLLWWSRRRGFSNVRHRVGAMCDLVKVQSEGVVKVFLKM